MIIAMNNIDAMNDILYSMQVKSWRHDAFIKGTAKHRSKEN